MPEENKPLITTIIPTYQRPKLLKRAILSVLNQTYPNFQVCVYDNASGDETAEVVGELAKKDSRIKYYCHSQNIGPEKNFNFGLSRVDTPYFSFLSDDDILLPNFYEDAIKMFEKYPEAGFVATQTLIASDKKIFNISYGNYEETLYQPPKSLLKMTALGLITWTGVIFRKEVRDKIGLLDEQAGGPADVDFLLRISSIFSYAVIKSPGAIFYYSGSSLSSNWSVANELKGFKIILEKVKNNENVSSSVRELVYQNIERYIIREMWRGGINDITKRRYSEAKKLSESLKKDFNEVLKADIIYNIARLCEFSNMFYYLLIILNWFRKSMNLKRKKKERNLQKIYGQYSEYFKKYAA